MRMRAITQICLLLLLQLTSLSSLQALPSFNVSSAGASDTIAQPFSEAWEAGMPDRITIFLPYFDTSGKILKVNVKGQCTKQKITLRYRCSADDYVFQTMDLGNMNLGSIYRACDQDTVTVPFSVKAIKAETEFNLKLQYGLMDGTSFNGFDIKMDLFVTVECKEEMTLTSNKLHLINMQSINNYNPGPASNSLLTNYKPSIFTSDGVQFMSQMKMGTGDFGSVQLIDPEVVRKYNAAPALLKSKLTFSAFLHDTVAGCLSATVKDGLYLGNYSPYPEINEKWLKTMYLNMQDGMLHYSTYGLSSAADEQFQTDSSEFGICGIVGSGAFLYDNRLDVYKHNDARYNTAVYKQQGSDNRKCKSALGSAGPTVTVIRGGGETFVDCPIVCDNPTETFKFKKDGADIIRIGRLNDGQTWYPTQIGSLEIHKNNKIIKFPSTVTSALAGRYSCEAAAATYSFDVNVIMMPRFVTALPQTVYAVHNESMSYSCSSEFENVASATLRFAFFSNACADGWQTYDLVRFNSYMGNGKNWVSVTENKSPKSNSLNVTVTAVPPVTAAGMNFTHRFICRASVSEADAKKLSMSQYDVHSSSDVYFVPRPTSDDFELGETRNCSECTAQDNGVFEFKLKPDVTKYLSDIGVEVTGEFIVYTASGEWYHLNGFFKSDIENGFCSVDFDSETNNLKFTVNSISDRKFLEKINKVSISPVFNYRYSSAVPTNLYMYKDKYQSSTGLQVKCVTDARCFYSTQFDADTMASLKRSLSFSVSQPVPAVPFPRPPPLPERNAIRVTCIADGNVTAAALRMLKYSLRADVAARLRAAGIELTADVFGRC